MPKKNNQKSNYSFMICPSSISPLGFLQSGNGNGFTNMDTDHENARIFTGKQKVRI
jgi:hypothetical protein